MALPDGRVSTNGAVATDPAHGGPLPDATFPELIGRFINDLSDLSDRQVELAKQELAETKDEAIAAVLRIAIGAGIAVGMALLLVIWLYTAFIWFLNWL